MEIISELQAVELLKATGFEAGQNTMILPFSPLGVVMAQGLNTYKIPYVKGVYNMKITQERSLCKHQRKKN